MPVVSGTWVDVTGDSTLGPGDYRNVATLRLPYNEVTRDAVMIGFRLKLEAQGFDWVSFTTAPPLWDEANNTEGPWVAITNFQRPGPQPLEAGFSGRDIAVILSLVAAVALAGSILASRVEKLVSDVTDTVKPILSPGTIVLVVLAIFLITRR